MQRLLSITAMNLNLWFLVLSLSHSAVMSQCPSPPRNITYSSDFYHAQMAIVDKSLETASSMEAVIEAIPVKGKFDLNYDERRVKSMTMSDAVRHIETELNRYESQIAAEAFATICAINRGGGVPLIQHRAIDAIERIVGLIFRQPNVRSEFDSDVWFCAGRTDNRPDFSFDRKRPQVIFSRGTKSKSIYLRILNHTNGSVPVLIDKPEASSHWSLASDNDYSFTLGTGERKMKTIEVILSNPNSDQDSFVHDIVARAKTDPTCGTKTTVTLMTEGYMLKYAQAAPSSFENALFYPNIEANCTAARKNNQFSMASGFPAATGDYIGTDINGIGCDNMSSAIARAALRISSFDGHGAVKTLKVTREAVVGGLGGNAVGENGHGVVGRSIFEGDFILPELITEQAHWFLNIQVQSNPPVAGGVNVKLTRADNVVLEKSLIITTENTVSELASISDLAPGKYHIHLQYPMVEKWARGGIDCRPVTCLVNHTTDILITMSPALK